LLKINDILQKIIIFKPSCSKYVIIKLRIRDVLLARYKDGFMYNFFEVLLACMATMFLTLVTTPILRYFAKKIQTHSLDYHDGEVIHKETSVATMGGLAIYASFFLTLYFLVDIPSEIIHPIFLSTTIIVLTGVIDDWLVISPLMKSLGIVIGATVFYLYSDFALHFITLPMVGEVHFGPFSYLLTMIWLLGFANSMNLIDGLDGLASGISIISLTTMGIIGFFFLAIEQVSLSVMIFILVAAIMGFWPYNFFPATIFLGDTGALFLGFMIGIFSLAGLKNATFVALILPIVILGIPFTDTIYAIIRRKLNNQSFKSRDLGHIHYRFIFLGMSHRQAVVALYLLSGIFSIVALLLNFSSFIGAILLIFGILISLELFVELIGLMGETKPLLNSLKWLMNNFNRYD
jgi:undecaprenyl-phosphate N-acetyl-glucosaminyl transferase